MYVEMSSLFSRDEQQELRAKNFLAFLETCENDMVAHRVARQVRNAVGIGGWWLALVLAVAGGWDRC